MGPLLGAEYTRGNTIKLYSNGDEFFPAMLAAIAGAQKSISLETYIWSSGRISDRFIAALIERAQHGVKVHVMVDGMGMLKFKQADQDRLLAGGVQYIVYGREHWWEVKPNINHRTHRKLLIIDGHLGFTGGMCIDDDWTGNATQVDHWREIQLQAEGPVVREMQSVFTTNWLQTTSRLLVGPDYFPAEIPPRTGARALCYKSGPGEDPENARISYLLGIASARKSIRIQHAYFVPDDLALGMLLDARKRGVEVDVIIPAHNDSSFGRAASRSRWGKLLAAGVRFHQYEPAMYHCKMMIVDDLFLTIGSVNFDNRSFGINDEVAVNTLDAGVARPGCACGPPTSRTRLRSRSRSSAPVPGGRSSPITSAGFFARSFDFSLRHPEPREGSTEKTSSRHPLGSFARLRMTESGERHFHGLGFQDFQFSGFPGSSHPSFVVSRGSFPPDNSLPNGMEPARLLHVQPMMRRFALGFCLLLSSVSLLRAAVPPLLQEIADRWIDERAQWGFTQLVKETGRDGQVHTRLERFDLSRGYDRRWQLLRIDGRLPNAEEVDEWSQRKNKGKRKTPSRGSNTSTSKMRRCAAKRTPPSTTRCRSSASRADSFPATRFR